MYTKQDIDAWLGPLTDPNMAKAKSPTRRAIRQVWTVKWNGGVWAIATDGHAVVLVAGEHGYEVALEKEIEPLLELLGANADSRLSVALDELREWTGTPPDCKEKKCDKCDSTTGLIVPKWEAGYGIICGILLDRRRLAHTLRGCRDQELTIFAGKDMLRIRSANMQVVLMGVDREHPTFEAPEVPIPVFKPSRDNATASGRR
jgi:hypothetical protein